MRSFYRCVAWLCLIAVLCVTLAACRGNGSDEDPIELKNLTWGTGAVLPEAKDFVVSLPEGAKIEYAETLSITSLGAHTLGLIVTRANGEQSEHTVTLTLIIDNEPPVLSGVGDLVVYIGEGISYRNGVTVSDNCDGEVTIAIDSSAVNTAVEGSYPVRYTATDASGNVTVQEILVWVYREQVTEAMLFSEIDRLIDSYVPRTGTPEAQARAIYDYVYYHIAYNDTSDKSDWVRAAYEGIRSGQGDCFTYFALSKAFFVRLGIESMDVKRTEGIVSERHYWNLVNIGTAATPRWYHFDACRILGESASLGCLMTDAQLRAFSAARTDQNGVSNYFYAYDSSAYPKTEEGIITHTAYDPPR